MSQFGGKDSKRHFTVVMGNKEHGLYVSSTPSSAAKKAVTKLCATNKSKKVEFYIREITQGSKKKTYGPYEGYIEKLTEPIELMGRVIRYKPVAKLSGKSAAKKGGMFRNPAAGPAPEPKEGPAPENTNNNSNNTNNSNSNNNSPWGKNEQIAVIRYKTPDDMLEYTGDLDEKIEQLNQLDNNIFYISIDDSSVNNGLGGYPSITCIFITFENLSKAKNKKKFKKHLNDMIEILKFFKNQEDIGEFDTKVHFFEPDEECFSPEHNEILRYLAYKINPIAPTVNQRIERYQHFPVLNPAPNLPSNFPIGNAPPLNNINFQRAPAPNLPSNFPSPSAPPLNNINFQRAPAYILHNNFPSPSAPPLNNI
jgi:hypothetical protein